MKHFPRFNIFTDNRRLQNKLYLLLNATKLFFLKFLSLALFQLSCSLQVDAQVGGASTYDFLNLVTSARNAALGGRMISSANGDLGTVWQNPALLTADMHQNIVLSYNDLFAGAGYGYAAYAFDRPGWGTFAAGLQYVDYGTFRGADNFGNLMGDFFAKDFVLNLSYARTIDSSFFVGINVKPIYSTYERYVSMGIATDLGVTYLSHDGNFSASLVLRNMGTQLKTYASTYEPLPFEILAGFSQKLQYAPFRFSFTFHHLQHFNMYYDSQLQEETLVSNQKSDGEKLLENILRHFIGSLEFLPSKTLYIAAAYNYQRRQEMALHDAPGIVGFSFGAGIRTQKFSISYGHAVYHAAGGSDHFSILMNLGNFTRKQ
ncbi:MAG: type IX secretion system protein PorQ [Bacteroidales bacterium]